MNAKATLNTKEMKHYKIQRAIIIGIIVTALMAVIYNEAFGQKKQVRAILHEYEMREFLIALNPRIDNELNNDAKAILLAFSDALEENGYGRKLDSISSRHYQYSIMFNIWEKDNTRENAAELMFLKHFNSFVWFSICYRGKLR